MADPQSTSSVSKTTVKPEQYAPPAKLGELDAEKAEHSATMKPGRSTAVPADRPVSRLMTVTITIDAETADVVRVEGLDATGARHELSNEEKTRFMKEARPDDRLAEVVERAFEAGIASVLGGNDEEPTEESPEDAELRHMLLAPLIERSAIRQLTERAALNRAILGTLIEHSMK